MNAAFLLVTTTWLAAADAVPQAQAKPADQKPATTAPAPSPVPGQPAAPAKPGGAYVPGPAPAPAWGGGSGSCGTGCCDTGCCDDGCGHKWGSRLRGLFHRSSDCCDTGCDSSGGHQWISSGHRGGSCGCDTGCGCDEGCGHKLFGRLQGLFNRHSDCCASDCCSSCSSGGSYGGYGHGAPVGAPGMMKPPEQIMTKPGEAKPMPSPTPGTEKKSELNPAPRLVPAPRTNLTVESTNPF